MLTVARNTVLGSTALLASLAMVSPGLETRSFGQAPQSKPEPPRFSTRTDVVRVYATVKNKAGHLVTDLEPDDFEVRDRGTLAPLAVFSKDALPITVAILVDMSGSFFELQTFELLRDGLTGFINGLDTQDRATVGWFSHEKIVEGPPLTSNLDVLKQYVMTDIRVEVAHPRLQYANTSYLAVKLKGRPIWNAIGAAMQVLAPEQGRKVVLVLANGSNTQVLKGYPRLKDVKAMIAANEFMVYGVHSFEPRMADVNPTHEDLIVGSHDERQTTLQQITELTGGGFIVAPFDRTKRTFGMSGANADRHPLSVAFRSQLTDLVDELRHQYTLGFVPTRRDGKVGKIEVRVKRPDVKVWARQTYLAPSE